MNFAPIAVVGRGCLLPGCTTPDELWHLVATRGNALIPAPSGVWGIAADAQAREQSAGGFVLGFDALFDPGRYRLGAAADGSAVAVTELDPVVKWLLHVGHAAWEEAGSPRVAPERIAVIAGNLSFPSRALSELCADIWLTGVSSVHPLNRHNSGYPARALALSLGAKGPVFCLDAACASSLYAIKLACDRLQDHSVDIAIAGAVNATDNLILHQGFRALGALSPSGRSSPLSVEADGLLPSEGAAAVVLKRLADISAADTVYGVIRGVGLSNDGCRQGLLVPDADGQREAMLRAYQVAGLDPKRDISLIECHATGTPIGDRVELEATASVFCGAEPLPVGSLKSNLGHLITAAGLSSLLKLMSAMEHETLPPTLLRGAPSHVFTALDLYPQVEARPWKCPGPRRAALSNFGFGGNNAHLILEQYQPALTARAVLAARRDEPIAICGVGLNAGADRGLRQVLLRLSGPGERVGRCDEVVASPTRMRVPPHDLARAQPQQLAVFDTVEQALSGVRLPSAERIGCFVGMRCASEGALVTLRARLAVRLGLAADHPAVERIRDLLPELHAAHVTGAMPNIPANRLNAAHDWRGPGFTVSAEEQSGRVALDLACRALLCGELDVAVAAAADFADNAVDRAVMAAPLVAGDGAAALVLKRRSDALRDGDSIFAELVPMDWRIDGAEATVGAASTLLRARYGEAPAASQLSALALQAALTAYGWCATEHGLASAWRDAPASYAKPGPRGDLRRPTPHLACYAASSVEELIARIETDDVRLQGSARLACVASSADALKQKLAYGLAELKAGRTPVQAGIYCFFQSPGELAFVYTGAAAAYPGMGRGLLSAFPELARSEVLTTHGFNADCVRAMAGPLIEPLQQLCATTFLSQLQTVLLREILGIAPSVAMGLSSGETNALVAFGAWDAPAELLQRIEQSGMYQRFLGGEFQAVREAWQHEGPVAWTSWLILAPVPEVRAALETARYVELTIIYSDAECVIGGQPAACEALVGRIGAHRAIRLKHDLAVHCSAALPYAASWRHLHSRDTTAPLGIRFYTNDGNCAYEPSRERVANALTGQVVNTIDFPRTIEQAYADGVRAFIELGPRDTLTKAITKTLGQRAHLAVATDRVDRSDLEQLVHLCATLFAANHSVDIAALLARLESVRANAWPSLSETQFQMAFPAHLTLPDLTVGVTHPDAGCVMPAAPPLAAVNYRPAVPTAIDVPEPAAVPEPVPSPERPSASRVTRVRKPNCAPLLERSPVGLRADRRALELAACGPISDLFGGLFRTQDQYRRQVRLPRPPMLLVDRITGIDAQAATLGLGTLWSETAVSAEAWSMHGEFMRPGPIIEAGQADLALISYMGVDLLNRGERVYRLLGCELTFYDGGLPMPGDTLRFQIEITGHAEINGMRLFFFQSDCRVGERLLLSVRNGQAGFFSDEELARSQGVLWDPADSTPPSPAGRVPQLRPSAKRRFTCAEVDAFRAGDAWRCFGDGFERAASHSRPATTPSGRLALIDDVPEFAPAGGPWGRGYLKARARVPADAWFYDGHFHNDPCMPGTLMAEAGVQALEFYAAGVGLTLGRDGYVFEPVSNQTASFLCRGQVVPDRDHELTYEIFIDEIVEADTVELYASILARSDGAKVFYCPRFGIRLRPHWPSLASRVHEPWFVSAATDVRGDLDALLECGSGAPSRAFGSMYASFDRAGRVPRLPQPPYHMVSRILEVSGPPARQEAGLKVVAEYVAAPDAWYFDQNGNDAMPLAVLTEVALQPCGWLASYAGLALRGDTVFRNLDGEGTVQREVRSGDGPLHTSAELTRCSRVGPMTLVFFDVQVCLPDGSRVMALSTGFGFFSPEALAHQAGLPTTDAQRALITAPRVNLGHEPSGEPRSPTARLAMLDEVDFFDAVGGAAGLGLIRGRQQVKPDAWYFKAHFFSDPVQPGSLGLDALVQLLERAVKLRGLHARFRLPRFQAPAAGGALKWTYRGQVTPEKSVVQTLVEIIAVDETSESTLVQATGSLWVDGLRIYEFTRFAIRIVEDSLRAEPEAGGAGSERAVEPVFAAISRREAFKPEAPAWVADHCPTYTVPVLPLMMLAGRALAHAGEAHVLRTSNTTRYPIRLKDFAVQRWASVPRQGCILASDVAHDGQVVMRIRDADSELWSNLAHGRVDLPTSAGTSRVEVADRALPILPDLYTSGELFHGKHFHCIRHIARDGTGFVSELDVGAAVVPGDPFDPVLLDGLVQCIPSESPQAWYAWAAGMTMYPVSICELVIFRAPPISGALIVRGRPLAQPEPAQNTLVELEASSVDGPFARLLVRERLFAKGALRHLTALSRRAFLTGTNAAPFAPFSEIDGDASYLEPAAVLACDWLPGTVATAYRAGKLAGAQLVKVVAVKEHFARLWQCHPGEVAVEDCFASSVAHPRRRYVQTFDRSRRAWRTLADDALVGGDVAHSTTLHCPPPHA